MTFNLRGSIQEFFKGEVIADAVLLKPFCRDASLFKVCPQIAAFPKDTDDIKNIVRFVSEARKKSGEQISLTCRAGGSDMTGGSLTESIVVDMTRHLNQLKEIGEDYAVAEPGMFYRDFEKETLIRRSLLLPSYPASKEMCALGGMVANNAGGEKSLQYGKTDRYVAKLKFVAADGNEYELKPLTRQELEEKMQLSNFEGELYRRMAKLVQESHEILQKAKPAVSKNSAGYALWNVWDKEKDVFDLTKVMTGSQGTLGIITEITFRLLKPHAHSSLLIIFLKDQSLLAEVTSAVLRYKPESFEMYDDHTFKLALRFFPDFLKVLKGNILTLALRFLPEFFMVLRSGLPKLILLAEFTADSAKEAKEKARGAQKSIAAYPSQWRITKDEKEAEKYFVMRRESFNLLRKHIKGMAVAPFIDDLIVPPEKLEEFLPRLKLLLDQYPQLLYTIAGHVGDGNLHIIPLVKQGDASLRTLIPEVMKKVHALVFEFKGSMTAEHNDGLSRTPFLKDMYGEKVYSLFEETKNIFDPDNIFNPGKKVGGNLEYAMRHIP